MMDSEAINKDRILQVMYSTIEEINETLPEDRQLEKSPATHLFGKRGQLDSLGLVSFIVLLEQQVADEFGRPITLADEKAVSRQNSPFLTVDTLADYIHEQLREEAACLCVT